MPFTKNFPTPFVLRGVHEIAQFLGVSDSTIYRWILRQHLPVGKLPDGRWATTPTLIDAWILYRGPSLMESDYIYKVLQRNFPTALAGATGGQVNTLKD